MRAYFATCAAGLEPVLAGELEGLGATDVRPDRGGVHFRGEAALLYRANLWLRTAIRVLRPILQAAVASPDDLYAAVRSVDWSRYLSADHTLAVDCNVRDSALTHSQYAARRVKDAICDQFRERVGRRPSVDPDRPMVGLNLHIYRDRATLSLDSSWESLHKRGYRPVQTIAPLNEALAAGLLLHAGWTPQTPLVDPLCGSGTFCIEAAWMALARPPGLTRKWFGFMGWPDFDRSLWNALREEARGQVRRRLAAPIAGSDGHAGAVALARLNVRAAGVGHLVRIDRCDLAQARPPADTPPGLIVCNPPYGQRLGEERDWLPLYAQLGEVARRHWPGWRLAVFTPSERLARQVGLPVARCAPFYNGPLRCHLWEFEPAG